MDRNIPRLIKKQYDLLVIGGGINGAATANLAAACGATVALLEKGDFASGTSSKSTKLLHGGIRYLENLEFDLVSEALKERFVQWQSVPYLVKPLSFIIPVYKKDSRPLWLMKMGVWLYDLLSGKYRIGQHRFLSLADVEKIAPGIARQGLVGAVEYFDAQMDDARIVLENVLMAASRGAEIANYVMVEDFLKENGHAVGVKARDVLSGDTFELRAKTIVSTVGPWTDALMHKDIPRAKPLLRPTKGVHIVYRGQVSPHAFLIQNPQDKRIFFIIPFKGNSLIGTTDTDYKGNPDDVSVADEDITYLLTQAAKVFGQITFERSKIITTFAGIRPLVADKGQPSKVSRKHMIEKTYAGIFYVAGGKYTTYRAIAEEVIKKALPGVAAKLPYSGHYHLYGSGGVNEEVKLISQRYQVSIDLVRYLMSVYGSRSTDVLQIAQKDHRLKERLCSCSPAIGAQVVYSQEVEMAKTIDDVYERRLGLAYMDCPTEQCRRAIADILKCSL